MYWHVRFSALNCVIYWRLVETHLLYFAFIHLCIVGAKRRKTSSAVCRHVRNYAPQLTGLVSTADETLLTPRFITMFTRVRHWTLPLVWTFRLGIRFPIYPFASCLPSKSLRLCLLLHEMFEVAITFAYEIIHESQYELFLQEAMFFVFAETACVWLSES